MALLDDLGKFIQTPAGIGLLSAVAGGAMGARRGTPWNNMGRAATAGLLGYSGAQDNMFNDELRKMQMDKAKREMADATSAAIAADNESEAGRRSARSATTDGVFDQAKFGSSMVENLAGMGLPGANDWMTKPNNDRTPSNVDEWTHYNSLSPQDQQRYLEMKRSIRYQDLGGYIAPQIMGGGLGQRVPKTPGPGDAPSLSNAENQRRRTEYETPGQTHQVTDPEGNVHTFPNRESADRFRKAAGIQ